MSEETEITQENQVIKKDDTQPLKPVKPKRNWRSILLSVLGVIVLLALGGFGGYQMGLFDRTQEKKTVVNKQLMEQFQYALVDEQFGRYDAAKQRLDFIIQNDPSFPGAQQEMAKVLVQMSIPTSTPTPTLTPTPDMRGEQTLFTTAQQYIATGDWQNALAELDQLRKEDPNYNTSQVDGMYYFALRNYGVELITKQGNLEGGIYELTLAENFAPLDRDANGLREGARAYIQASRFYGADWTQAAQQFAQVASGWPGLWDGTMTAVQRYQFSLMRYGDLLFQRGEYCQANDQYQTAMTLGQLDKDAAKNSNLAYQQCFPATPTSEVVVPTP